MPGSWGYFRHDIKEYLTKNFDSNSTILDVGCGQGDYADMLTDYFGKFDAVEIFEPYIEQFNLKERYNNVYNVNILDFDFEHYDIIIMGDILEHLSREDAVTLIDKLKDKCNELMIVVPYYLPQDTVNDNIYERHLQPDIDDEIMEKYFPSLELLNYNGKEFKLRIDVGEDVYYYCTFVKRKGEIKEIYTEPTEKVILTMTTLPDRLLNMEHILDRLTTLSYKNYEIHLNLPFVYLKKNMEYVIPNFLSKYDSKILKIYRTDDLGPITKILPTIERIDNPETVIITVDDDLNYMDGFIEYHLEKRKQYPNSAIGFAGIGSLNQTCHFCTTVDKDVRVKLLEGYKTVSYKRKFFQSDFKEFSKGSWNDDIIISAYMGKNYVEKIVVNYNLDTDFSARVESFPVIGHSANEQGGCWLYRNDATINDNHEMFHNLGYLER